MKMIRASARGAAGLVAAAAASLGLAAGAADRGPENCGNPFDNGEVGPYDYNNAEDRTNPQKIPLVERFHFNRDVEGLDKGASSAYAMDDLDYTLRAIPNHPRALNAVARYDVEKGGIPPRWRSAECWFDRALTFRPEDGTAWLVYANYKARKNDDEAALDAYQRAKKLLPDSVEVDYNLGLLYFKLGRYDESLAHARTAYAGNYPLQGLRRKLAGKGYDVDR